LSVLLKPKASSASLLPLAAGVAVASALSGLGVSCELKWPNDVLAGGRKLAGILAESSAGGQGLEWVVLGIGVNVALDPQLLPGELRESVASVRGAGASASPDAVAAAVLADLGLWYDACLETPRSVVDAWRARAAPWWGALVEVRSGGTALRGRLLAVDDAGALVIELPDGERRQFVSGEVERLRQAASS
jgi:BirA family biotin operon repressor/biotin-[acetyl-CoA-carboxylase] ligase